MKKVLVALVGAALLISFGQPSSIIGAGAETPTPVFEGGYVFSNIEVDPQPDPRTGAPLPGHARITFGIDWEGSTYPGEHQCLWRVYDENGFLIGEMHAQIMSLEQYSSRPIYVDVNVRGDGAEARISCDGRRLDGGSARFAFSNVAIAPAEISDRLYDVTAEAEPVGAGRPRPQVCTLTAFSESGDELFTTHQTFVGPASSRRHTGFQMKAPSDLSEEPSSADIGCRPFD